jgi:hypothetical protein
MSKDNMDKDLTKKVTFVLESGVCTNPVMSDRNALAIQEFEILHINDFTQEKVKAEQTKYDTEKVRPSRQVIHHI